MKLLLSILTVIVFGGCIVGKNINMFTPPAVVFEKTACFGTCPEFMLEVFPVGSSYLTVRNNMPLDSGKYLCLTCSPDDLKVILKKAKKIKFKEYQDKYDPGVTDLPSIMTRIEGKLVTNIMDAPAGLIELEQLIDSLYIQNNEWQKLVEKK